MDDTNRSVNLTDDRPPGVEHWAFRVESPILPVQELLAQFENASSADAARPTTWTDSPEQRAFREAVLARHLNRSKARGRAAGRDLGPTELGPVGTSSILMRKDAALAAGRLIAAANAALAEAQRSGDADAKSTRSIEAVSGYRDSQKQARLWRAYFSKYYTRTASRRNAMPSGPHGDAAQKYMIDEFRIPAKIAAPGYSNHQNGIAIDLRQVRIRGHRIRNSSLDAATTAWRRTWFFRWLTANAASFGFEPYVKEPWHWEYRPKSGAAQAAAKEVVEEFESEFDGDDELEADDEEFESDELESDELESDELEGDELENDGGDESEAEDEEFEGDEEEEFEENVAGVAEDVAFRSEESEDDVLGGEFERDEDSLLELEDEDGALARSEDEVGREAETAEVGDAATLTSSLELLELDRELEESGILDRFKGAVKLVTGPDLKLGDKGPAVTALQYALLNQCIRVGVDGDFGRRTVNGVKLFQSQVGRSESGVLDADTKRELLAAGSRLQRLPSLPDAIASTALVELRLWNPARQRQWEETDPQAVGALRKYWAAVGVFPSPSDLKSANWQKSHFWSAAFICWVMCKAGAGERFAYSAAHRTYARRARLTRDARDVSNPFWAYQPSEVAPEPGDLLCNARSKKYPATWSNIVKTGTPWALHCDIVTSRPHPGVKLKGTVIDAIGGNKSTHAGSAAGLSVSSKEHLVDASTGLLFNPGSIFMIIRCRGPKPGDA